MEPSSEDEEAEIDAAFTRSQMQAMSSEVNDAVSREIACGSRAKRATYITMQNFTVLKMEFDVSKAGEP